MAKLITRVAHKANTQFMLKGEIYKIGADCTVEVENPEHVGILLQNTSWRDYDGKREPVGSKSKTGKFALLGKSGEVIEKDEKPPSKKEIIAAAKKEGAVQDPPIPEGDEAEWADPKVEYSKKWLMACAKAYGMRPSKKWSNEKLVEKINSKMYE
jgi:hypothetical protein